MISRVRQNKLPIIPALCSIFCAYYSQNYADIIRPTLVLLRVRMHFSAQLFWPSAYGETLAVGRNSWSRERGNRMHYILLLL